MISSERLESTQQFRINLISVIQQEEQTPVKKSSHGNYRILFNKDYTLAPLALLQYIKDNKTSPVTNDFGDRLDISGFVPFDFTHSPLIQTSIVVVGVDKISLWEYYCSSLGIKYNTMQKPKQFKQMVGWTLYQKQTFLQEFQIIILPVTRMKDMHSLLGQQQILYVPDTSEKNRYQQLQHLVLNFSPDNHDAVLKIEQLRNQLKFLIRQTAALKHPAFVYSKVYTQDPIFERVILDDSSFPQLSCNLLSKMTWMITTDPAAQGIRSKKRFWQYFNNHNIFHHIDKFFINGFLTYWNSLNLSNIKLEKHVYKQPIVKKSLCPSEGSYLYTTDSDFITQFDISTRPNNDIIKHLTDNMTQYVQSVQNSPLASHYEQFISRINKNISLLGTIVKDKIQNPKEDEGNCIICYAEKPRNSVLFACCFAQLCISCFSKTIQKTYPKCIQCRQLFHNRSQFKALVNVVYNDPIVDTSEDKTQLIKKLKTSLDPTKKIPSYLIDLADFKQGYISMGGYTIQSPCNSLQQVDIRVKMDIADLVINHKKDESVIINVIGYDIKQLDAFSI